MIKYIDGDIFKTECSIIVNPVNCEGIMGAGLAKEFKKRYPVMFMAYEEHCKYGLYYPGRTYVYFEDVLNSPRIIINFTTKDRWRNPSKLIWINNGLDDLAHLLTYMPGNAIAIPALGCGHGGLEWSEVKERINYILGDGIPGIGTIEVYNPK